MADERTADAAEATGEILPPASDMEEMRANQALIQRPMVSIRTRITLAFALLFALCVGINLWFLWALGELEDKIRVLEIAGSYLDEIQQARRFEKNFLLYHTDLAEAEDHLVRAERILEERAGDLARVLGRAQVESLTAQVRDYHAVLGQLSDASDAEVKRIEPTLRDLGGKMVAFAEDFLRRERRAVDLKLGLIRRVPFYFLAGLMALMVFLTLFLARQLIQTLDRFVTYAKRIGEGDFSPVLPTRKYRDEFTHLAEAFNHMTRELERRYRILVESHKLRAVGTLVAGVAHELNNPLNNSMLTAAVLKEDFATLADAEKLEMVEDLIRETERSQRIVRNLLDFARESETRFQPLAIERILEESVALLTNQLRLSRVRLEKDIAPGLPPVHGDEQMLKQVFVNLILNALEALSPGGRIHLSIRRDAEVGYVAVDVADDGPGIPEHVLPRIFEPFFTTKAKTKGTGLGLWVCRGIVSKLGGFLRVRSEVGEGTTFTVLLPVTEIPVGIGDVNPELHDSDGVR